MAKVKLGLALQQALNELAVIVRQKKALINKTNLPELNVNYLEIKNIFYGVLYAILKSHDDYLGCKINITATRDLNDPKWVIAFHANARSFNEYLTQNIQAAVEKLGGNLEIG